MSKEIEIKEKHIIQLFTNIMGKEYVINSPIQQLGGMNNDSYKVCTDLKNFVFRFPGKGSNESVNRYSELFNSRLAYDIGLDCNLVYCNKTTGVKIAEYIEDAITLNIVRCKKEDNIESMAYALNILHNSEKRFYRDFDPFKDTGEYKQTIVNKDADLLQDYKELDSLISYLKKQLQNMPVEYVVYGIIKMQS